MLEVERALLAGRAPRYVQIPTAAAPEGPESVAYWIRLGAEQAARLGVEAVPVAAAGAEDAADPALAGRVRGAGLIYLSGGSPGHLSRSLRASALWEAVLAEWRAGAALAGCSAGAMSLGAWFPSIRRPRAAVQQGLGLIPRLGVIPHFDRVAGRFPELLTRPFLRAPDGLRLIGIDERTAMVWDGAAWTVQGAGSVWLLGPGSREGFATGQALPADLPAPAG